MKDGDGNHSYVDDKLYPLVMTNKKRLKPWPSRNSGFTQLQNGGSFHSYVSLPEGICPPK